ncbi:hypothetical protein [Niallia circulans]|uniref:hypothetical protein n=1 Tax=Niallia circulans TaxID=1397 RepID=UPI0013DE4676|nr:hypothetical protein [Niallia circulans]
MKRNFVQLLVDQVNSILEEQNNSHTKVLSFTIGAPGMTDSENFICSPFTPFRERSEAI